MKDRLTLLLVSVLCSGVSYAQAPEQKDSIDVRIYFKQGSSVIDMKFKDNQNRLGLFADRIAELERDSLSRILSIYVSGTASPEGNSRQNKLLSRKRAASAAGYVYKFLPDHIETSGKGIGWEGLAKVVFEQSNHKDINRHIAVRDFLRTHPDIALEYGELKMELAYRFSEDIEGYCTGKDAFVKQLEKDALLWYQNNESYKTR